MKLPNIAQAQLPQAKITGYLLSFTHADGRSKAEFFTHFGFSADQWQVMATALIQHAQTHDVYRIEPSPFGKRYIIEGSIESPDDRNPNIRAIWFVGHQDTSPHFVTAYPLRRQ